MCEWRPIDTAPKKRGSTAIIFAPSPFPGEKGTVGEAFLGKDGFWYWSGSEEGYHDSICESNTCPTYWQQLPEPPSE